MKPSDSFIAGAARLFSAISLAGFLAGCTTPMAGRQDLNHAQLETPGQTDSLPGDLGEIPPDERPF